MYSPHSSIWQALHTLAYTIIIQNHLNDIEWSINSPGCFNLRNNLINCAKMIAPGTASDFV